MKARRFTFCFVCLFDLVWGSVSHPQQCGSFEDGFVYISDVFSWSSDVRTGGRPSCYLLLINSLSEFEWLWNNVLHRLDFVNALVRTSQN